MAKIIYKNGYEGQNRLSCIEGIEIELLNGQKALIYPKYAERQMLKQKQIREWDTKGMSLIEALKVTDVAFATKCLRNFNSPAAEWVSQFKYAKYSNFVLPSLLAAMEVQHQKKAIDALAETIEGADLLRDYIPRICSCSMYLAYECWYANGIAGCASYDFLGKSFLAVPTIIY